MLTQQYQRCSEQPLIVALIAPSEAAATAKSTSTGPAGNASANPHELQQFLWAFLNGSASLPGGSSTLLYSSNCNREDACCIIVGAVCPPACVYLSAGQGDGSRQGLQHTARYPGHTHQRKRAEPPHHCRCAHSAAHRFQQRGSPGPHPVPGRLAEWGSHSRLLWVQAACLEKTVQLHAQLQCVNPHWPQDGFA